MFRVGLQNKPGVLVIDVLLCFAKLRFYKVLWFDLKGGTVEKSPLLMQDARCNIDRNE